MKILRPKGSIVAAVAGCVSTLVAAGSVALAQPQPQGAPPAPPPPNADVPPPPAPPAGGMPMPPQGPLMAGQGFGGSIVSARPFSVRIQRPDGRYVTLKLRAGTVINPIGTTLAPGMWVVVRGTPLADGSVYADQVDLRPAPPGARQGQPPGGVPPAPPPGPGARPPAAPQAPPPR